MKKITAIILAAAASILMLCGCGNSDSSKDSSSASSTGSSTQSAQPETQEQSVDSKYDAKFAELIDSFDYSSYESFEKNFTKDSNKDYIKQSYESLKQGFLYEGQVCIGIDKGIYYYLFRMTVNETTQASLVALEYNDNEDRFYVKMNSDIVSKGNELMQKYICTECSGTGTLVSDGENVQCSNCYGFGILFP